MSERQRPEGRKVWPWYRRIPTRIGKWAYNIFLGPFLTKLPDGTVQASMTRIAVAVFTIVEAARLLPQNGPGDMKLVPVIGWADAFLAFCTLFALPIDGALTNARPAEVLGLLGKPFARASDAIDQGAQVTTTLTQDVTPSAGAATPTAPPDFTPHEWADGHPDEGVI